MGNFLLLIVTILKIVPLVMEMIRDKKIKDGTTAEVLRAFEDEFNARWKARIDSARRAGESANNRGANGVPNGAPKPVDPFDRASKRTKG